MRPVWCGIRSTGPRVTEKALTTLILVRILKDCGIVGSEHIRDSRPEIANAAGTIAEFGATPNALPIIYC